MKPLFPYLALIFFLFHQYTVIASSLPGYYSAVFQSTTSTPPSLYEPETNHTYFFFRISQLSASSPSWRLQDVNVRVDSHYNVWWSGVFFQGTDSRIVVEETSYGEFLVQYNYNIARGWRVIDVEVYQSFNQFYYVGVFRPGWGNNALFMGTWSAFTQQAQILAGDGVRMVAVETFVDLNGNRQWLGGFQEYDSSKFAFWMGMSASSLEYRNGIQANNGLCMFKLINYEDNVFAAIWTNNGNVFGDSTSNYACAPATVQWTTSTSRVNATNLISSLAASKTLVSMDVSNYPCLGSQCIWSSPSSSPGSSSCTVYNGMTLSACQNLKANGCSVNWHGRGCYGARSKDGGCQLNGWCKYRCARLCYSDPACVWTNFGGGLGTCGVVG